MDIIAFIPSSVNPHTASRESLPLMPQDKPFPRKGGTSRE